MLGAVIVIVLGGVIVFWLNTRSSTSVGGTNTNASFPGINLGRENQLVRVLENTKVWVLIWTIVAVMILFWIGIPQFIKDWWTGTVPTDGTGPAPETNITDTIGFWDLPPWVLALMAIGVLAIAGVTFLTMFSEADSTTIRLRRMVMTIVGVVALIGAVYLLVPMINADWSTFVMPSPEEFSLEKIWELVSANLLVGGLLLAVGAFVLTFFFGAVQNMLDPGEGGKRMVQITTGLAFACLVMFVLISLLFEKDEIKSIRDGVAERIVTAVTIDDQADGAKVAANTAAVREYFPAYKPVVLGPGDTVTKWAKPGVTYSFLIKGGTAGEKVCVTSDDWDLLDVAPITLRHREFSLSKGVPETFITLENVPEGTQRGDWTCE